MDWWQVQRTGAGKQRLRRPVGVVVLIATLATGCVLVLDAAGGAPPGASADEPATATSGGAVIQQIPAPDRVALAPFRGQMLDGSTFDSEAAGAPVAVYNVWGSWCGPCRREAPALRRAAELYLGRVAFVGINIRDDQASARAFERAQDIPYSSVVSADSGDALLAFGAALSVAAVPATVVVDSDGLIAARVVGPTSFSTLRGLVDDVLAESGSPGGAAPAG